METNMKKLEPQEGYSKDKKDLIKYEYFEVKEENIVGDVCADNGTVVKQEPSENTYEEFCEDGPSKFVKFEDSEVKEEILDSVPCVDTVVKQESLDTEVMCSEDDALESKNKDSNEISPKKKKHQNVCQICSRDYSTRKLLLSHVCGSKNYVCTTCGKLLNSLRLMKRHTCKVHKSSIDSQCCRICKKRFKSKDSLDRHRKEHHRKSEQEFICDICDTRVNLKSDLVRHIQSNHAEKTFRCGICDEAFFISFHLTDHIMSVHSGVGEISCKMCNKKFARQKNLLAHVKLHGNKRPFKCDFCNKGFNSKGTLKIHTQRVHGSIIFCGVCKKDFVSESDLDKHRANCTNLGTSVVCQNTYYILKKA